MIWSEIVMRIVTGMVGYGVTTLGLLSIVSSVTKAESHEHLPTLPWGLLIAAVGVSVLYVAINP